MPTKASSGAGAPLLLALLPPWATLFVILLFLMASEEPSPLKIAPPLAWPNVLMPSAPSPALDTLPVSVQLVMVMFAPCRTLLTAAAPVLAPLVPVSLLLVKEQLVSVAAPS